MNKLETKATCCKFTCKHCNQPNSDERIKELFIIGLNDKLIQTAIIKTESITPGTSLKALLHEATALEQSMKEQSQIKNKPEEESTNLSE